MQESSMKIRDISPDQLAQLGMPSVAYFKPVTIKGMRVYAIHTADGTHVGTAPDQALAIEAVLEHEMQPTWVH
jgi:hypothetical protein